MTSKQATWTPGPWHVRQRPPTGVWSEHGDDAYTIGAPPEQFIAAVKAQGPATEANARLIAMSPTMAEYVRKRASQGCEEARGILDAINA